MLNASEFCIVTTSIAHYDKAVQISKILISEQLAACCNIIPNITSIYNWKDEFVQENEFILLIKTKKANLDKLELRVTELHTYEVPEFIAHDICYGSLSYLNWMSNNLIS